MTFEIVVPHTGDRAEADSLDAALVAAATLCDDHAARVGTVGALRAARSTVIIVEDGAYQGIATALAREGHRSTLSAEWSR